MQKQYRRAFRPNDTASNRREAQVDAFPARKKRSPVSWTALIAKVSQSAAAVVFHPPLAVGRRPVTRFCRPLAYQVRGHDIHESTSGLLLCKCRRKYRRLAHTPGHLTQRTIAAGFWDYYISLPAPMSTGFQSFSSEESSSILGVSLGFCTETITFVLPCAMRASMAVSKNSAGT